MKKIIAFLLCAAMCVSFSSCGSPDKEITIPATFFEGTEITQEDINEINDGNFKSVTLNDDGSVTYVITAAQHKELMDALTTSMQDSFNEIINDDAYSINYITPNSDYTSFEVELSTETLGFVDRFSVLVFYAFGGMYNFFNGTPADNISVVFVNSNGDIIETTNSNSTDFTAETQSAETPKKEITYKEAIHNSYYWTDSQGNPYYTIIDRIENTSDTNIFLSPSTFDIIEDYTDKLLGTGTASPYPDVLAPGKISYYYADIPLNHSSTMETSVVSHLKIEESKVEPLIFPVTDVTFTTDEYGRTSIMGRVENTTSEEQNLTVVSVMIYDRTGRPFLHEFTYVSLAPYDKMGFEIVTYALGTEYNVTYDIGAFATQFNY